MKSSDKIQAPGIQRPCLGSLLPTCLHRLCLEVEVLPDTKQIAGVRLRGGGGGGGGGQF